jgi:hypothetical protein
VQQRQRWGSRCHVLGAASVTGFASVGRARTAVEITPPRVGCCGARRTAVGVWSLAGRASFVAVAIVPTDLTLACLSVRTHNGRSRDWVRILG